MAGKIDISSGTEDLTSGGLKKVIASLGGEPSTEGFDQNALLSMFFHGDITQEEVVTASSEAFNPVAAGVNADEEGCRCNHDGRRPPLVSRVIDPADGHSEIRIIYDANPFTGGGDMGVICGIINAAAENDVVDITIAKCLHDFAHPRSNLLNTRAILNAIETCKGKVITRIGTVTSVDDLAVWLSGKERHMSPMGWICIRQPEVFTCGSACDMEDRVAEIKNQLQEFVDFIVSKGWFSQEEFDKLYNEQTTLSMTFDDIAEKMSESK